MTRFRNAMTAAALLLGSSLTFSQELPFTHYTQDNEVNPLPSADVRTLYQDRLGYIWMVIYSSGLVRYDGHTLDRYTTEDGLPDITVRQVLEDQFGRLWVSSDAGLAVSEKPLSEYFGRNRIRFRPRIGTKDLVKTTIVENRLCVDGRGWLWVGTRQDGIIRYRFQGSDSVHSDTVRTDIYGEGKNKDVRSIIARRDGSVWVGIGGGDLMTFSGDALTYDLLTEKAGVPRFNSDVLHETHSGKLFGGCRNGLLWQLVETDGRRRVVVVSNDLTQRISSIVDEPEGILWVASNGSGVMRIAYRDDKSQHQSDQRSIYTKKNGLLSNNVSNIMQDREKNIWLAQSGGISKLRPNYAAFFMYTATSHAGERPMLATPAINVVIPPTRASGFLGIVVGTSGGGVTFIAENGDVEVMRSDRGLKNDWVNGLAFDNSGRLWIGSDAGINCLSFDPKAPPPPSHQVRDISIFDRKGTIAAYRNNTIFLCKALPLPEGTEGGKTVESLWFPGYQNLYCYVENEWFVFRTASGLPSTFFHDVAFDNDGKLWVGTRDGGLYRSSLPLTLAGIRSLPTQQIEFQEEKDQFGREMIMPVFVSVWNRSTGAPSNQIDAISWRHDALWTGTTEGLAVLKGEPTQMVTHVTIADGLGANNVTSMAFSSVTGSLWVGTNAGLAEIDPTTRKILRNVTKDDGLVDNEVWSLGSVAISDDGTVYYGTARGLSVYRPSADMANRVIPLVRLQQAQFIEDLNNNEIEFEYAALSFGNEKLVRYKSRLVGYDKTWSPEKAEISIRYTNLPAFFFPKAYTFEVHASNNHRLWTETPLTYSFSVQPPWWFRWWWLSLNTVLLVAFVYGFSRYRTRQLEERSRQLEKTVEERTQEISVQAEQLAKANTELEEKNQQIMRTQEQLIMQEKLASLGALTAGIAHEIKNPLNFVNNFAELSTELIQELREDFVEQKDRLDHQTLDRIEDTLRTLEDNATKINEHGKRADGIVRGMLLHSRGKSGERMPTDINSLLEEYITLAYHGLQAQDADFRITINTDYDRSIGQLDVVPQDLSRAFLNIVNNACYAANERKKEAGPDFSPTVSVHTKNLGDMAQICIRDNGKGIPKEIIGKIFEPFFTTKPTGKGTGLGLSLSYDIVKQHHGEIKVDTQEGEYAEFIIRLPRSTS